MREISSLRGGHILFRVTTSGPFSFSLLTDKAHKAALGGDLATLRKERFLVTLDVKDGRYERIHTVPAG